MKHADDWADLRHLKQPPGTSFGHLRKVVQARRRVTALGFKLMEAGGGKFRLKVAQAEPAPAVEKPRRQLGSGIISFRDKNRYR